MNKPNDKATKPLSDHRPDEELDWLAFCFVTGELSEGDAAAFEQRLSVDQAAREAVAQAVELCQAAAVVCSREVEQPSPACVAKRAASWSLPLAWMSIGASAALVLVTAWIQADNIQAWFRSPPSSRQDLAEVWSRTREGVRDIVQAEVVESQPLPETQDSGDLSLPSWITAAVSNQLAEGDPDADGSTTHDET